VSVSMSPNLAANVRTCRGPLVAGATVGHRPGMTILPELLPARADHSAPTLDPLRLAVAAHLAPYKGDSRLHVNSDLRAFLLWCADRELDPLAAARPHLELYVRWMQEVRGFKPSTVSRRMSVVTGFYRTCVIDGLLEHSPAEFVRRPNVAPESPCLGLTHLQLEALLTASRDSTNPNDFALVCLLSLLGLRIFEATGANARTSARSTATGSSASAARARRLCWSRCHPPSPGRSTAPSAPGRQDHCC
jgi:hypothetical protein